MCDELRDLKDALRLLVWTVQGREEVCSVSVKATGSSSGTLKR